MNTGRPCPGTRSRDQPLPFQAATVVGLGGVGRQVAVQLASLGIPRLKLIDGRIVVTGSCMTEGYAAEDAGRMRIHTVAQHCHELNPPLEIETVRRYSTRTADRETALFYCQGLPSVWRTLRQQAPGYALVAHASVHGSDIQLHLARDVRRMADGLDRGIGGTRHAGRQPVIPSHIASVAAGLLVGAALKFACEKAPTWQVRFDLDGFRLQSGTWT